MMQKRSSEANNLLHMPPDEAEAAIDRWAVVLISQSEAREIFALRIKLELAMARRLAATQRSEKPGELAGIVHPDAIIRKSRHGRVEGGSR